MELKLVLWMLSNTFYELVYPVVMKWGGGGIILGSHLLLPPIFFLTSLAFLPSFRLLSSLTILLHVLLSPLSPVADYITLSPTPPFLFLLNHTKIVCKLSSPRAPLPPCAIHPPFRILKYATSFMPKPHLISTFMSGTELFPLSPPHPQVPRNKSWKCSWNQHPFIKD
jgi:hypothetical protein